MFTLNNEPSNSSEIIESGFTLYRATWIRCFTLSFFSVLFFLLPLYWPHFFSLKKSYVPELEMNLMSQLSLALAWGFSLVLTTSLIFKLHCEANNLKNTPFQAIKHSISRCIPLLLVSILYVICVLSGTALLIVPGFILSVSLMFCFFLVINENKGILMALLASHRLIWGHWWHSFVVMSVPLLLIIALNMIMFILMVAVFSQFNIHLPYFYFIAFTTHLLLQSLMAPFTFSVALTLLHDLRMRQRQNTSSYLKY